jgi:dienelactone hydrolase
LALAGCAGVPDLPHVLGGDPAWQPGGIAAGPWRLAMARKGGNAPVLHIYIEGDGRAYITAGQPAGNPTPEDPVGLNLARRDPAESVIYLARPCQYVPLKGQRCTVDTWTAGRFNQGVVEAYAEAVASLLATHRQAVPDGFTAPQVVLIGYSGGADIALAVAQRVAGIDAVVTVAGNIDPAAVNAWHKVAAQPGAVRPYVIPGTLRDLPVLHLVGADDTVVPPGLVRGVIAAAAPLPCTEVREIEGVDHHKGWVERWPALIEALPVCHMLARQ